MNEEITLREVADYLDHVGIQFMATIGLGGKPKVRPMQYMCWKMRNCGSAPTQRRRSMPNYRPTLL